MREEIEGLKKEVKEIKKEEESFAMSMLKDYKKQNKRQFIIILVILSMWFVTIGYLVYLLNDISYEETTTTETYDMSTEDGNNNFIGGDNNGEITNN